jgi:hypothetical protein
MDLPKVKAAHNHGMRAWNDRLPNISSKGIFVGNERNETNNPSHRKLIADVDLQNFETSFLRLHHTIVLVTSLASASSGAMNLLPSLLIVGLALPPIAYIS